MTDQPPPAYAAIDLGTNNCRMLMAEPRENGFAVVDSFSRIVRLGEGVAASGTLSEDAIRRTLSALKVCRSKILARKVERVRCITTEACRRAGNKTHFIDRVLDETGLVLEAISPNEEAGLTVHGCRPLLARHHRPRALMFDIGGGSTEVIWINMENPADPQTLAVKSLSHGVVTLSEQFPGGDTHAFDQIVATIDEQIADFDEQNAIADAIAAGDVQMLGTSGTVTTLGALHLGLGRYDRARVDGIELAFDDIRHVVDGLGAQSIEQRMANPCIGPKRGDLIMAGCAILEALCRRWPVGRVTVADRGIREGILMKLMAEDGVIGEAAPS